MLTDNPVRILAAVVREHCFSIGKGFLSKISEADIAVKDSKTNKKATVMIYSCIINFCHNLTIVIPNDLKQNLDDIIKKSSLRVDA
jgi:hypothetical protein